jgi:hypothetical protein
VKLSTLLIVLAGLLSLTTMRWSELRDRRTISQIYRDARAGKQRSSAYQRLVGWGSLLLLVVGVYLALTWR